MMEYRTVRVNESELNEVAKKGFRVVPGSVFQSGPGVMVVMEREVEDKPAKPVAQKKAKPELPKVDLNDEEITVEISE